MFKLIAETSHNQGFYKPKHKLKLKEFLQECIESYQQPIITHIRINPRSDSLNAFTQYMRNRLNRRGIPVAFIKATENNEIASYLHQHWFLVVPRFVGEQDCFKELLVAAKGARQNGVIRSWHLCNKKIEGPVGSTWVDYETPWFPLTEETFVECMSWCSYALKQRSKDWALANNHNPVTWSFPSRLNAYKNKLGRSVGAKAYYGYVLPQRTQQSVYKRCAMYWSLVQHIAAVVDNRSGGFNHA